MLDSFYSRCYMRSLIYATLLTLLLACSSSSNNTVSTGEEPPAQISGLDLLTTSPAEGLVRVYGSTGDGRFGVPVTGGHDCNADGFTDYALAAMRASPAGRTFAGEVYWLLGNGRIDYTVDTATANGQMITIIGAGNSEAAGSEIWMDDVNGDGIGDLLIARQNFRASSPDRIGAGSLTIILGSTMLSTMAANNAQLDLANTSLSGLNVITIIGANTLDRLGIWMRTADIDGDGIRDIVIGADQQDSHGEANSGAAYVIRGGAHLNNNLQIDLANFGSTALAGNIARILPPMGSSGYHFGATLTAADLDGNDRSEVLVAAALNRAGASILPDGATTGAAESVGGSPAGSVYILWDDNFATGSWPNGFSITLGDNEPGSISTIHGGSVTGLYSNRFFGEEILGGLDYNADGEADLFIGDISGTANGFSSAGIGFVIFSARQLQNQTFVISNPPVALEITTILGPEAGAIASDTALQGDFDGDGLADLAVAAPHAAPLGRRNAGSLHVLWGQAVWPAVIDLRAESQPAAAVFRLTNVLGARGDTTGDHGDTLAYSAAPADLDSDGRVDLIINEMLGNGLTASAVDSGNLLAISGELLATFK